MCCCSVVWDSTEHNCCYQINNSVNKQQEFLDWIHYSPLVRAGVKMKRQCVCVCTMLRSLTSFLSVRHWRSPGLRWGLTGRTAEGWRLRPVGDSLVIFTRFCKRAIGIWHREEGYKCTVMHGAYSTLVHQAGHSLGWTQFRPTAPCLVREVSAERQSEVWVAGL